MKKKLLLFFIILTVGFGVNAQCTPDPQFTDSGIYPDSATGLSNACADQAYSELITNVVPLDTITMFGPVPVTLVFDSVVISSWTGLPPGFTYACYDGENTTSPVDQCAFEGNTKGCVLIEGNPTAADIGSYQQMITVDAYLGGLTTPTTTQVVDYYYIHIVDCTSGLNALSNSKFLVYPNPAKSSITLNGLNGIDVSSVEVVDMAGQTMKTYTNVNGGALDMDINHLDNGMYFIWIHHEGVRETIKFIKE